MPAAEKNSSISFRSGAPPHAITVLGPPRASRIDENTSLSAIGSWAFSQAEGWRPLR